MTKYAVTAVGNALVDILTQTDETFLQRSGLAKGTMQLVDHATSDALYKQMGPTTQQSGGSAANTIAGLASFGASCAFIGKIADDALGKAFHHDMRAQGIDFDPSSTGDDAQNIPTGSCMVLITPDAERTMVTHLGISTEIAPDELDKGKIQNAQVTYLEGYLYDKPLAKETFTAASMIAHMAGKKVALTLSDPFCVDRHREDFKKLVDGHIDILFCNHHELLTMYETDDLEQAIAQIADKVSVCAITQGENGATILQDGKRYKIAAQKVHEVIDTTGAGDMFAAGFLYGYTRGESMEECGRLGAVAAAEIISHVGARPQRAFKTLLAA